MSPGIQLGAQKPGDQTEAQRDEQSLAIPTNSTLTTFLSAAIVISSQGF